ncbi:MAG: hypothetical protein HQ581_21080 [Planctomycetes bacterium]|nr:hypothetical protein [Planctomycetota bacterium]
MPKLLALEWNEREVRAALAVSRAGRVTIEQAFSVPLHWNSAEGNGDGIEPDPGPQVAAALAERGIGRVDTIVAVGRTDVELRQLALPPMPEEELPEAVRFQALRQFNALGEDWPLDFVLIDEQADGPRNVLAAALDPDRITRIRQVCQAAGLRPRRLLLRSAGAASLLCRRGDAGVHRASLLVELTGAEAELTVMVGRKIIFLRTARLAGDPLESADRGKALVAEIRRTTAAVANQLDGRQVESIALCGTGQPHETLARQIKEELGVATSLFDPFAGLEVSSGVATGAPEHSDRFAPLLGMLLDELEGQGHGIDFLHPRRRPAPPGRQRQFSLAAIVVGLLVAVIVGYAMMRKSATDARINKLKSQSAELDRELKQLDEANESEPVISKWLGEVPNLSDPAENYAPWLDELTRLAEKLEELNGTRDDRFAAKKYLLQSLSIGATPSGGNGQMAMSMGTGSMSMIRDFEMQLRDKAHRIEVKERHVAKEEDPSYPCQFGVVELIQRGGK